MPETMVQLNDVELCAEAFGRRGDPALLLIAGGASSMDWWDDEFCRRLAAGGRFVIRYDHRDTGRSTTYPPGRPPYNGADLANDALGVLDAFGAHRAHLVGLSMGGALAQRIAVERPHRLLSLTLMSTAPGPGPGDDFDAPADPVVPDPIWSNRRGAVDRLVAEVREWGGPFTADDEHLRRFAERVYDRTTDMAAAQVNHWVCGSGPPYRQHLGRITAPALIMHGTLDPVFPAAAAEALAAEIPDALLVWLDGVGHEFPPRAVWNQVIAEILGAGSSP
jgi:pimeloyl-ACP methyl ester carboxylesterase